MDFIMNDRIIRLTKKEVKLAGEVLGRALCDDPIIIYLIPEEERRRRLTKHIYQMTTCLGVRYGEVYANSPNLEGVATWHYLKELHEESFWGKLLCSIKGKIYKVGIDVGKKHKPMEEYMHKVHKEIVPGEHWYLYVLGVEPSLQGKGHGSALVEHKLEDINQQGIPAYLETSLAKKVKFYEKLGFQVIKEGNILETEVYQYYMLWEPR